MGYQGKSKNCLNKSAPQCEETKTELLTGKSTELDCQVDQTSIAAQPSSAEDK